VKLEKLKVQSNSDYLAMNLIVTAKLNLIIKQNNYFEKKIDGIKNYSVDFINENTLFYHLFSD
jgi:hypothetical protein